MTQSKLHSKSLPDTRQFSRRPTWAVVDLDAVAANLRLIKQTVGPDVQVMGVVKANAYGHGAVECGRRLRTEGADWLGVALPEEGARLRAAGIAGPILVLGGFWPGQEELLIQHGLVPVVYRTDMVQSLQNAARQAGLSADVHVKIDTGMGRLGLRLDDVREFLHTLGNCPNIRVDGLMTHLAAADEQRFDDFTRAQAARFDSACEMFAARNINPRYRDVCNSPGLLRHPTMRGNLVRPGGVLYGLWCDKIPLPPPAPRFTPALSLYTCVSLLKVVPCGETVGYGCSFTTRRNTTVAILPVGYQDGYMRSLSGCGHVLIRGQVAQVVGRVSMDLTIVDVTDIPDAALFDKVTLLGNDGVQSISAEDLAAMAGTISYEFTCGISERVPREYNP